MDAAPSSDIHKCLTISTDNLIIRQDIREDLCFITGGIYDC